MWKCLGDLSSNKGSLACACKTKVSLLERFFSYIFKKYNFTINQSEAIWAAESPFPEAPVADNALSARFLLNPIRKSVSNGVLDKETFDALDSDLAADDGGLPKGDGLGGEEEAIDQTIFGSISSSKSSKVFFLTSICV